MRALVYHSSHEVSVDTVPDPALREPDDIIVRVTSTAIDGADLHLYHGKVPELYDGAILGHEFMGEIVEAGRGVALPVGTRVVVPSVLACGSCYFCRRQLFAACETSNPESGPLARRKAVRPGAALFGCGHLHGGLPGGQAEYVRVPKANVGPLAVPPEPSDEQLLFLGDTLASAYQAVLDAGIMEGDSLVIFGAGPLGLMAAACARMRGAGAIFMVDHHGYRLDFAVANYGAVAVDGAGSDVVEAILEHTDGRGADGAIDAAGCEAKGGALDAALTSLKLEAGSCAALRQCIDAVRRGGAVSVPGSHAGAIHGFQVGEAFDKGIGIRAGWAHVQRHMPELLAAVVAGKLQPQVIVSHRLTLEQAVEGYRLFDLKEDNCRKVVLRP